MNGRIVKELGDGVLASFASPVDACRAAVTIREWQGRVSAYPSKAGIAVGQVEELDIDGRLDLLGDAVDRSSRIQGLAQPGQILIDRDVRDLVQTHLKDEHGMVLGDSVKIPLKGIGETEIYEISSKAENHLGFGVFESAFKIHEEGRLSVPEKVAFFRNARKEVIELGVGLTTFSDYFWSRKPAEFKQPIADLLSRGVHFKCYALDPAWRVSRQYFEDRGEEEYLKQIPSSINALIEVQREFKENGYPGKFDVYTYRHLPYMYALCVDAEDHPRARMMVSPYLFGVNRASCPVLQFTSASSPKLLSTYWTSVKKQIKGCKRVGSELRKR
jgi:hypothetical protein